MVGFSVNSFANWPLPSGPHPRLYLTSDVMVVLQKKAVASDPDWLDLKARADLLLTYSIPAYDRYAWPPMSIPYSYQGSQWLEAAQVLGLAYKVTGNTAYADKLKVLIDVINASGTTPVTVDSGFPSRTVPFAMALMYDWLYDYLDAPTKSAMIATINSYYASYVAGVGWYMGSTPAYDNYFGGHLLGFGTCALATYGDNATAPAMLADIRTKWDNNIPAAFESGGFSGGGTLESFNYGPNHFIRLLQFAIALQTATGEDIYSSYGAKIAQNLLYNLKPNRWQATDEGDFPGTYVGVMPSNLPIILSAFTSGVEAEWMAHFYSNLTSTPYAEANNTIQRADYFTRFLFKIPRPLTDYRNTEPTHFRSSGDEHVYMRSDWTDNAVWASYMAGNIRWVGHAQNSAGHVSIQRGGDYLLVNSGPWKGDDGLTGSPRNFNTASQWTNTLYFTDGGDYMHAGGLTGTYAGGQMSLFPDTNRVRAYSATEDYTYAKADHTNAYDVRSISRNEANRSLRYFYRSFVYLKPGTFVVYDRVKALKTEYVKKLRWHLNKQGQPVKVDNKTFSSTVKNSRLFVRSVYPTTSVLTIEQNISDGSSGPIGTTTPRIDIADSVKSTDFNHLTVLVTGSSTATMPPTERVESVDGKMIGTYIKDPTSPNVVMFSTTENDVDGDFSYTISVFHEKSPTHLIVDLPKKTKYTFIPPKNKNVEQTFTFIQGVVPGKEGSVYETSDQGTIRISPPVVPALRAL
jgi:hypothetical protein